MKRTERLFDLIKRNAIYMVLSLCIIAVGVSVALMLANDQDNTLSNDDVPNVNAPVEPDDTPADPVGKPDETPETPVDAPVVFIMPVANATSIGEYSETMVFNSTLGRYSTHLAIDFFAEEGAEVFAVYDGVVEDVQTTLLKGTTITIDHGNGLKTIYNSLADGEMVSVGQTVKKGDVIGQVSVSNRQESADGAHLHFEVSENGQIIDPAKYLEMQEK